MIDFCQIKTIFSPRPTLGWASCYKVDKAGIGSCTVSGRFDCSATSTLAAARTTANAIHAQRVYCVSQFRRLSELAPRPTDILWWYPSIAILRTTLFVVVHHKVSVSHDDG